MESIYPWSIPNDPAYTIPYGAGIKDSPIQTTLSPELRVFVASCILLKGIRLACDTGVASLLFSQNLPQCGLAGTWGAPNLGHMTSLETPEARRVVRVGILDTGEGLIKRADTSWNESTRIGTDILKGLRRGDGWQAVCMPGAN